MKNHRIAGQKKPFSRGGAPYLCAHFRFGSPAAATSGGGIKNGSHPQHPVQDDCDLKSIRSVKSLVDAVHRMYGSLENPAAAKLVLHTQADFISWRKLFVPSPDCARIYNTASRHNGGDPLLMIVRPVAAAAPDMRGRRRFQCAETPIDTAAGFLRPILVCHTKAIADAVAKNATMLVAARPHLTPADRRDPGMRGKEPVPVYLHITHSSQMAVIGDRYWNPARPEQMPLFDGMKP